MQWEGRLWSIGFVQGPPDLTDRYGSIPIVRCGQARMTPQGRNQTSEPAKALTALDRTGHGNALAALKFMPEVMRGCG